MTGSHFYGENERYVSRAEIQSLESGGRRDVERGNFLGRPQELGPHRLHFPIRASAADVQPQPLCPTASRASKK
jgi:hypothetical protein